MHANIENLLTDSHEKYAHMSNEIKYGNLPSIDLAHYKGTMKSLVETVAAINEISVEDATIALEESADHYSEEIILPLMKVIWENEGTGSSDTKSWDDLFEYPISDAERGRIMARLNRSAHAVLEHLKK